MNVKLVCMKQLRTPMSYVPVISEIVCASGTLVISQIPRISVKILYTFWYLKLV